MMGGLNTFSLIYPTVCIPSGALNFGCYDYIVSSTNSVTCANITTAYVENLSTPSDSYYEFAIAPTSGTSTNFYLNFQNLSIYMYAAYIVLTGAVSGTSFSTTSDYRIKTDVISLSDSFTIDNLNPITYFNLNTKKQDIGLIAHEVQEWYPCLVNGEKDGDTMQSVNYTGLIPVLIKEIQMLKERIKTIEEKI